MGRNVTWGEMLQGKMLHWEKCYIGENVTGENVTGEFVTGENVLGENVIHPLLSVAPMLQHETKFKDFSVRIQCD